MCLDCKMLRQATHLSGYKGVEHCDMLLAGTVGRRVGDARLVHETLDATEAHSQVAEAEGGWR